MRWQTVASPMALKGDHDRAIADYSEAIRLKLEGTWLAADSAQGDYDRAIADYNEALRLKPNSAEALDGRGAAYGAQRRLRPRDRRL